ncbi:hypothetical protein [Sorangium sp. So ce1024]|uniref:YfiM family protein n=1 Tax=Sorangium sp. So ce1024 TaxID=3133327 RepID=UPI003EFF4D38
MRSFLPRAALAAPVLAAAALAAPPAQAQAPLPRAAGAPLRVAGAPLALPGSPAPRAAGAPLRAAGAPLRAAGAPLALPGSPPPGAAGAPLRAAGAPLRAAGAPPWLGSAAQPLTRDPDPWFGDDKARHFCASIALAGGGYALGALATDDLHTRIAVGAVIALGAGIAKEVYDAAGHGTPSLRDLVWDALGTTAGLGLSVWFDLAATPISF